MRGDRYFVKTSGSKHTSKLSFVGEAEDVRGVWRRWRHVYMFKKGSQHDLEEGIFAGGTPDQERDAPSGLENAANFGQGFLGVRKKHHAKAAGNAIE